MNELQAHLSELRRSKPYREVTGSFGELATVLARSGEHEQERLRHAIATLLTTAEVIPLDAAILSSAARVQIELDMSPQDAIVFASILAHLGKPRRHYELPESCFLNRNTKDFDAPDVRERLDSFGCRFFGRFDEGLRYIQHRTRPKDL